MELKICHLYPELLNLYGDSGNILTLKRRCEWRDIKVNFVKYDVGDEMDFSDVDIFFIGGGADSNLDIASNDIKQLKHTLEDAIKEDKVILAVCGGYQLLGNYYQGSNKMIMKGLGLLDFHTKLGDTPMVGDVVAKRGVGAYHLVGFENHAGKTYLNKLKPLAYIVSGFGNNGEDKTEGVRYKNVFGTYLHGPLLPKNPKLCDEIIEIALRNKYDIGVLKKLDDFLETKAREQILKSISPRFASLA